MSELTKSVSELCIKDGAVRQCVLEMAVSVNVNCQSFLWYLKPTTALRRITDAVRKRLEWMWSKTAAGEKSWGHE